MTYNILGYYRNFGSLRYGNEYCVEFRRCMGKNIFSSSTEAFSNHAFYNCTWIDSCRIKKTNQCSAVAHKPMTMKPAIARQNRRDVWLNNQLLCHRNSDFFEGSNRGVQLIAGPGMQYSFPYLREPRLR